MGLGGWHGRVLPYQDDSVSFDVLRGYAACMPPLDRGLYELLIDEDLEGELGTLASTLVARREALRPAEAGDRIAWHLSKLIEFSINGLEDKKRAAAGIALARQLIKDLAIASNAPALLGSRPVENESVLAAVLRTLPDGSPETFPAPLIPLLDTTILTNAPGEPRVGQQIRTEIDSASAIDVVMAFVRRSGLRPLKGSLARHCQAGRPLRVLTTTYTESTECEALEELQDLGADVRVSYDTSSTRLHAKAWLFHRPGGMATAYVGSSNLTHWAQQTGLEWNLRISGARNPSVTAKIAGVFEAYWASGDFLPFMAEEFRARTASSNKTGSSPILPLDLHLHPFQERLLEQVQVARARGRNANLLVSATGTGKTVMAAVDYTRLVGTLPRGRLLFVAHREEILKQSLLTYRQALRDGEFGEMWTGQYRPRAWEHVFASIQTLNRSDLSHLAPDHFDVVVVDEFHHAAASSYERLLTHVRPRQLLGLTATPERADNLPILDWFGGRIAADLRLWDAIDQQYLAPFEYYGVHDAIDLRDVPWKRGRGYDIQSLENVYTADEHWARQVLAQLEKRVDDIQCVRALGFCVSVVHARFMARVFQEAGVSSAAVWGDSPDEERHAALEGLKKGSIQVLFSVDLFNEGVDLPTLDTLLLLRPTQSATLFLQQLGRGLRKANRKRSCLVLDFVGLHRAEFRFDQRLRALLGGSRKDIERQVEQGFPFLPAGCHMELEPKAQDVVLRSLRTSLPSRWPAKVEELRSQSICGRASLRGFVDGSGLDLEDVYAGGKSWSDLREDAGLEVFPAGPSEGTLRRACGRLLHIDDAVRIEGYSALLRLDVPPTRIDHQSRGGRLARMLVASVCGRALHKGATLDEGLALIWRHPQVRSELLELLPFLGDRVGHSQWALRDRPDVPLQVHARYSRLEILAAFDPSLTAKVAAWQTGVRWIPDAKADLLAFTLDKTVGQFSPTTRYRDYAINPKLIHWESQGVTREASPTGLRYQRHVVEGSSVMLFARESVRDRAFWFLGPAKYLSHQGELPMAIRWELEHALPGDLFAVFAAAVA